ncbi:uncharacterized protein LOC102809957 [Saccoglossus kowalevskii]|uniref:Uncharacterized protein LOC102809957 n=1 Tax=Saccoglossus kowalevskii TaxID=10224 RepID=A0ABM0MTJ6_SACKO|nr:PREDICTED: uncharacterized protein LOC102809957 [Saccoglossus kowalevskii]
MIFRVLFVCLLANSIHAQDFISANSDNFDSVIDTAAYVQEIPEYAKSIPLSWETQDELLQLEDSLKFQARTENDYYPTPIYRKDLPRDYVAYWEIEVNDNDHVILSAGPQTGDTKIVHQSDRPSPTQRLAREAKSIGETCVRYYMYAPEGTMFCENGSGKVVATTLDPSVVYDYCNDNSTESKEKVNSMLEELNELAESDWVEHAERLKQDSVQWQIATVYDRIDCEDDLLTIDNGTSIAEQAIHPGEAVLVAIGGDHESIKVRYVSFSGDVTEEDVQRMQAILCNQALDNQLCKDDGTVTDDKIEVSELNGIKFIAVALSEDRNMLRDAFDGNEISFQVEIRLMTGKAIVRNFGIELETPDPPELEVDDEEVPLVPQRKKRYKQYKSWTSFTYHSILYEQSAFPKYWQKKVGSCYSGCGPVAWAMVFGYFDRMAHMYGVNGELRELWRSGPDGTTGSQWEMAPYWMNNKVHLYIKKLRNILHTFCLFGQGATWQWRMDDIEGFFTARGGSHVNLWKTDGLVGIYSSSIRNKARNRIRDDDIPAVIGRRVSGFFSQHYPVATRYRWRKRQYRICVKFLWWKKCGKWRWEYDRDFYLHMGWTNGGSDGWWSAKAFMAAAAYPQ